MSDKDREAFDMHITGRTTREWGQRFCDEHWITWRAAKARYAPAMAEKEAVVAVAGAIHKAINTAGKMHDYEFMAKAALKAAGVRFKDEA